MGLATINVKFTADLRGFSTEMQNSMRRIGQFGSKMTELGKGMSMYVTGPLLAGGAAAIKFASDYNESLNKVDVAFKNHAEGVKEFAKNSLESFGIAEGTALDLAATYGDMATSMDIPTDKAAKMSETLVGLAGDLSSFKNIGIDQANTALAGIFTGETESLKKLGIVMTEANLQSFAMSKGMNVQIKDMDQASKVNLRYAYILNATKNAQGDFIRTGGGAANQMRIFQESLKQVAQQFGSVMIPAFTKAIVYVNGLIKSFGNLSQGTKETIVVVAAVVASIGPLLTVFGSMLTFVPNLITKFNGLKDAFLGLRAVIVANPYTALAVAIGAIALALYTWNANTEKVLTSQQALNKAVAEGNKNAATEVGALDKLYSTATSVKASTDDRREAIKKLQELYPAYFKNIDSEAIKNGTAKDSYLELRDAIFAKSRATAIDNQLQENANNRISKEIELQNRIVEARKRLVDLQKNGDATSNVSVGSTGGGGEAFVSVQDKIKEAARVLGSYKTDLQKFYADSKSQDAALLAAKAEYSAKTGKLAENDALKLDAVSEALSGVVEGVEKVKSINLEPIDISLTKGDVAGSIAAFDAQIDKLQEFRDEVATTAAQAKAANDAIKNLEFAKVLNFDPTSLVAISGGFEKLQNEMAAKAGGIKASIASIGAESKVLMQTIATEALPALTDAFSSMGTSIVESLGLAKTGFQGFIGGLLQTVTKLVAMMLASSISQSIAGATASGAATGPAAVFTTPAFIATAIGGVLAAFAAIPKFETGGVFGGSSYYGDKILARVNSGEMVANSAQQQKIWGAMQSNSGTNITLGGGFVLDGHKLRLVLDRADERKNRIG